ncbi:MAG: electron transport complex subunit RsxE, partial [Rhodothermales bacterium]|nr:electron transport complex subunit RsxE [Rhodothermales bacterium]
SKNSIGRSVLDALGMGAGFTVALLCLGIVREVLGNGTFMDIPVFGPNYEPWVVMVLPGGAFFVLGAWLLLFNWLRERKKTRGRLATQ